MQLLYSLEDLALQNDTVVSIGTFDGVHRGHQHLLAQLMQRAHESARLSVVLTFYPHPRLVLHPEVRPACLSTPSERAARLEELGIDMLIVQPFTLEFATTPAETLVRQLVVDLRMRELWVGADFALGRGRVGDVPALSALGERLGYRLQVVEPLLDGGEPISSTRIRKLIQDGEVGEAGRLLGRPYTISGPVVPGRHRGRQLGFRTANLRLNPECAYPADGVYAVRLQVLSADGLLGAPLPGVANLGVRPSFGESDRLLEVHLFDYQRDLYAHNVRVEFVRRLRPERVFENADALIAQIRRDTEQARAILAGEDLP